MVVLRGQPQWTWRSVSFSMSVSVLSLLLQHCIIGATSPTITAITATPSSKTHYQQAVDVTLHGSMIYFWQVPAPPTSNLKAQVVVDFSNITHNNHASSSVSSVSSVSSSLSVLLLDVAVLWIPEKCATLNTDHANNNELDPDKDDFLFGTCHMNTTGSGESDSDDCSTLWTPTANAKQDECVLTTEQELWDLWSCHVQHNNHQNGQVQVQVQPHVHHPTWTADPLLLRQKVLHILPTTTRRDDDKPRHTMTNNNIQQQQVQQLQLPLQTTPGQEEGHYILLLHTHDDACHHFQETNNPPRKIQITGTVEWTLLLDDTDNEIDKNDESMTPPSSFPYNNNNNNNYDNTNYYNGTPNNEAATIGLTFTLLLAFGMVGLVLRQSSFRPVSNQSAFRRGTYQPVSVMELSSSCTSPPPSLPTLQQGDEEEAPKVHDHNEHGGDELQDSL